MCACIALYIKLLFSDVVRFSSAAFLTSSNWTSGCLIQLKLLLIVRLIFVSVMCASGVCVCVAGDTQHKFHGAEIFCPSWELLEFVVSQNKIILPEIQAISIIEDGQFHARL